MRHRLIVGSNIRYRPIAEVHKPTSSTLVKKSERTLFVSVLTYYT
jgi:hypothetical protein